MSKGSTEFSKKWLSAYLTKDERKKAKEDGQAYRQAVSASRRDLEAELKKSRAECREGSRTALDAADTVFGASVHELRAVRRGDKKAIRAKCAVDVILSDVKRATEKQDFSILEPYARAATTPYAEKRAAEQRRDDQRAQRRMIEGAHRAQARKAKPKSTGAERRQEREEEVLSDIPAEYHALYRSVGRRMPAPRNQSRAEQFMHWIHEHPEAINDNAEEIEREAEREAEREMERRQAEHFAHANTLENFGHVEEPLSRKRRPAVASKRHQAKPKPHGGRPARDQERRQAEHFSHANAHEAFEDDEPTYPRLKAAPTAQEAALEAFFDGEADPDADSWVPDPEDEEAPPARGLALWRPQPVDAEEPRGRASSARATREERGRSPETSAAPAEGRDARRAVIREASAGNLSIQFPTPPSLNVTKILTAANFTFKRHGGRGIVGPAWMARANTPHLAAANRARDVYEAEAEAGRDPRMVRRDAKVAAAEARGVISSDDPHALAKLRAKLETADSGERTRLQYRIDKLERAAKLGGKRERFGDAELVWNAEENRLQVFFPGKPDEATRSTLKGLGFRWAPSVLPAGAWVRGLKGGFAMDVQRSLRERAVRLGLAMPEGEGAPEEAPPAPQHGGHERGYMVEDVLETIGAGELAPDAVIQSLDDRSDVEIDEPRVRATMEHLVTAGKLSWVCATCGSFADHTEGGGMPAHNAVGALRCSRPDGRLTKAKRPRGGAQRTSAAAHRGCAKTAAGHCGCAKTDSRDAGNKSNRSTKGDKGNQGDERAALKMHGDRLADQGDETQDPEPETQAEEASPPWLAPVLRAVARVRAEVPMSAEQAALLDRFLDSSISDWGTFGRVLDKEWRARDATKGTSAERAIQFAIGAASAAAFVHAGFVSSHIVYAMGRADKAIQLVDEMQRRSPPPARAIAQAAAVDVDEAEDTTPIALRIGLVASAKQQVKGDRKGRARDLYVGPVFRNALRYAEATCDRVFILSPLWGAISPDTMIQTYNQTLDPHRAAGWFNRIRARLVTPRNAQLPVQLVLLTGDTYAALFLAPGKLPEAWRRPETPLAGMSIGPRLQWLAARVRELDAAETNPGGKTAPREHEARRSTPSRGEALAQAAASGAAKATPDKREAAEEAQVREARAVAAATVREAVRVVVGAVDEKSAGHETRADLGLLRRYLGHESDTLLPAAIAHAMRVPREDERTSAADAAAQALEAVHALLEASALRDEARGILAMLERAERHAKQAISFARAVDAQLAHKVKLDRFARGRVATDERGRARDQVLAVVGLVLAEVLDEQTSDAEMLADRRLLQRFARGGGGPDSSLFADVEKRLNFADKHRARTTTERAIDYALHAIERLLYGDEWKARLSDHGLGCYEQAQGQAEMGVEAAKRAIKDRGSSAPTTNLAARLGLEGNLEEPIPDRITTREDFERAERRIVFLRQALDGVRAAANPLYFRESQEKPTARKGSALWSRQSAAWEPIRKLAADHRQQEAELNAEINALYRKQSAFEPGDGELDPPSVNPAKVREDYSDRREQRIERLEARAEKTGAQANSTLKRARELGQVIPFGQPILVGHHSEKRDRNFRARIGNTYDKGFALTKAAEDLTQRAAAASENTAISSDDPNALEALAAKLAKQEQEQERMIASNKAIRDAKKRGADPVAALVALGHSPESAKHLMEPDFARRIGYPNFRLTNNGAEIRRTKKRIADLTAHRAAPSVEQTIGEVRIHESDNRIKITFPAKPPEEVRAFLKGRGFRFAKREGVWQRQSSVLAHHLAQQAASMLAPSVAPEAHDGPVLASRDDLAPEADETPPRAAEPIETPSPIARLVEERERRRAEQTATQLRRAAIVSNLREYVILVLHSDPPDIVSDSGTSARDLLRRFQADEAMTGNLLPYFRRAIQEHWTGRRPGKTDDGIFFLALRAVERALSSWDLERNDPNLPALLDDAERLSHELRDLRQARRQGKVRPVTPEPVLGASSPAFDAREGLANAVNDRAAATQNRAAREAAKAERDARPLAVRGQTSTEAQQKPAPHQATISGEWEPATPAEKPAAPKVTRALFGAGDTVCAAKAPKYRGIVIGPEYLRAGTHLVDIRWTHGLPPATESGIASATGIPVEKLFLVRAAVPNKPVQTSLTTIGGLRLDDASNYSQKGLFS